MQGFFALATIKDDCVILILVLNFFSSFCPRLLSLHFTLFSVSKILSRTVTFNRVPERPGAAPPTAEAPAAPPTKKLDHLFFIEEPRPAHVTESESHQRTTRRNTQHTI